MKSECGRKPTDLLLNCCNSVSLIDKGVLKMSFVKGTDLNLSGAEQIRIALRAIHRKGGVAFMSDIYEEMERQIYPHKLSKQGKASLRFFVNKVAVIDGLIHKHDPDNKGWRMTKKSQKMFQKIEQLPKYGPLEIKCEITIKVINNNIHPQNE